MASERGGRAMKQETRLLGALWQPAPMNAPEKDKTDLERSFLAVRKAVGYLGIFLPLSLLGFVLFTSARMETSISGFYYTPMRDVFVGTLIAIGVFLASYTGYKPVQGEKVSDRELAVTAGLSVLVVALVPTGAPEGVEAPWIHGDRASLMSVVHLVAAAVFFACLASLSLHKFPRGVGTPDAEKAGRNRIYRFCGVVIWVCLGLLGVVFLTRAWQPAPVRAWVDARPVVFWLEAIGVFAFGFSWLTKGLSLAGRLAGKALAPRGRP